MCMNFVLAPDRGKLPLNVNIGEINYMNKIFIYLGFYVAFNTVQVIS